MSDEAKTQVETAEKVIYDVNNGNPVNHQELVEMLQVLKEIRDDTKKEMKYARRQTVSSLLISILCLVIVAFVGLSVVNLLPRVNKLLITTDSILAKTDGMMEDLNSAVKNLNDISNDLAKVDVNNLFSEVEDLVIESQESINSAMEKIEAIKLDELNDAIEDFGAVVEPLGKLFGRK